jgi:hypothetical protein
MSQLGQKEQFERHVTNPDLGNAKNPEVGKSDVTSAAQRTGGNYSGVSLSEDTSVQDQNASPGIH